MKIYACSSIFWALLALKPLENEAFVVPRFQTKTGSRGVTTTTTASFSSALSTGTTTTTNVCQSDEQHSFPDFEKYLSILMDPGTAKLPDKVLESAFEILYACSKQGTVEGAEKVEQLLKRFEKENGDRLSLSHYSVAIEAWANSGHKEAAKRSQRSLSRMEEISKTNPNVTPTRSVFNIVLRAYAEEGDTKAAYNLLKRMEKLPGIYPNTHDYNVVLTTFARQGKARKAEEIMKRMVDSCNENGSAECAPDLYSYNILLDSWAKAAGSGERFAGQRAQEILAALESQSERGDIGLQPVDRTYTSAMCAVIRSEQSDSVEQAQKIFDRALSKGIIPEQYMYASLMDAYASVGDVKKAESLMTQLEEEGIASAVAYNTVIKAIKSADAPDAPERAEAILNRMTELGFADTISYTTVISAFANRGNAKSAEKAEELLEKMHKLYEKGEAKVKPSRITFNSVINAWVRCGDCDRAEKFLDDLERLSEVGDIRPNVVSYTTIMNGWANSGRTDGLQRAERLFQKMTDMYEAGNKAARPNSYSYGCLITAYARSGEENSAQRAEDLLFQMYKQYKEGRVDMKPNTQFVLTVIDCWQKSGKGNIGERAEALLAWLVKVYEEENDESFQPNEYTFSSTIASWSKSRSFGKARKAYKVLQWMKELYASGTISVAPNIFCYTAVINSAAYSENDALEKRDALEIALATYKELEQTSDLEANNVTFATMLTALRNLLPPSPKRTAAANSIFKRCCDTGYVDKFVVRRLESMLDEDELKQVVPKNLVTAAGKADTRQIPEKWQRNLRA